MIGIAIDPAAAGGRARGTVVLLAGQSNMVGRAPFDGGALYPAGTTQWGRGGGTDGTIVAATPTLQHADAVAGDMGLALQFAIDLAAIDPGDAILFVPCARGGTGFSDNRWNPGDDLYADAVARTTAALAARPGARLVVLWHQGERDAQNASHAAAYQGRLDAMIAAMRAAIPGAATAPFVLGRLLPATLAKTGYDWAGDVDAAIAATPARLPYTAVAAATALSSDQGAGAPGDALHFDAPSLRTLGSRYAAAVAAARANLPSVPAQVTGLALTPAPTSLAASWSAPASGGTPITDYLVEVRQGSGAWSTVADGTSTATSATIAGLASSTAYGVRVAAVNAVGAGPASAEATATTTAAPTAPAQVTGLAVTPGNAQNALAWSAPANGGSAITDYVIEVSTNAGATWSTVADGTTTATSYTHTGLANGTAYGYRVAAVNAVGTGTASATQSGTPAAPSGRSVTQFAAAGDPANAASYTFPGLAVTAGSVIVGVFGRPTAVATAVTVGGVAATKLGQTTGTGTVHHMTMWLAEGVTGSSAAVAVTMSGSTSRCAVVAWSVSGAPTAAQCAYVAVPTDATARSSLAGTIDVAAGGLILAHHTNNTTVAGQVPTPWSWTGATKRLEGTEVESQIWHGAADHAATSAETGRTVQAAFSLGQTLNLMQLVAVAAPA